MRKWLDEDIEFTITVLAVGPNDDPVHHCRVGFEKGDQFICRYDCPGSFCPKTMGKLHTLCEVVRGGGDLRKLGGYDPLGIIFVCADGCVQFDLKAEAV